MSSPAVDAETGDDGPEVALVTARPRGWVELALLAGMYLLYSLTRNQFGSAGGDPGVAYANALQVIRWEEALGIYHEHTLQELALRWPTGIRLWNIYYGSLHFIVPIVVLIALWKLRPDAYSLRRSALVFTTILALIGFSLYPLMPPRLLCDCPHGSGVDHGFVDTLAVHGGLWSFDSEGMQAVSNQYAAMPSLHFGWSLWCALAAQVLLRRRRWRIAVFGYPLLTLTAIVVTGNHYVLDAVGGALVAGAGWGLAVALQAAKARWWVRDPSAPVVVATREGGYRGS